MRPRSPETLAAIEASTHAEPAGGRPAGAASQNWDQPIDRNYENRLLEPMDATSANDADHRHRAAPAPPSTPPRQPCRLGAHLSEMAIVVRPSLRLDHEPDAGLSDRHRVDVPAPAPGQ